MHYVTNKLPSSTSLFLIMLSFGNLSEFRITNYNCTALRECGSLIENANSTDHIGLSVADKSTSVSHCLHLMLELEGRSTLKCGMWNMDLG